MKSVVIFSLALVFLLGLSVNEAMAIKLLRPGQLVPEINVLDLEGNAVILNSLWGTEEKPAAKKTVIVIFNTVCGICREEIENIQTTYGEATKAQIVLVGVDMMGHERIKGYMDRYKISIPAYADPEFGIGKILGVGTSPATVIIDEKGVFVEKIIGYNDETQKRVDSYIK